MRSAVRLFDLFSPLKEDPKERENAARTYRANRYHSESARARLSKLFSPFVDGVAGDGEIFLFSLFWASDPFRTIADVIVAVASSSPSYVSVRTPISPEKALTY